MTQKIIAYILIAVSFFFLFRRIYRFIRSTGRGKSSVPEKCRSCPEFRVSCSDPENSGCSNPDDSSGGCSCC